MNYLNNLNKRQKTILATVSSLILLLAIVLGFCWKQGYFESKSSQSQEKLTVGMEVDYWPFNGAFASAKEDTCPVDGSTSLHAYGYDVLVAQKIATKLKRRLVIKKIAFDGLIPALQNGEIDLIIAGMTATAGRKDEADFSKAYLTPTVQVIFKKSLNATNLADLKNVRIGAQQGTTYTTHKAITSNFETLNPNYDSYTALEEALKTDAIDGYIAESALAQFFLKQNPDIAQSLVIPGFDFSSEPLSIGVKKNNTTLLQQVNEAITATGLDQPTNQTNLMKQAIEKIVEYTRREREIN
ncbi:transporter substrate-binding domain-containing protein [Candidatus Phytoplasma solani]|uniref:transporter substrate-binding domain-containing protein n=1 Tax=Candidatus Phytoplasma solani TaxID=69896 RepID=UPI0003B7BDEC|nr:transporter substrate-binding domain-containing protein [Candidatus Phytoplasma solani]CCP88050.1 amino acid ABC transporter, substrate-binding [Candidatus Phytoplasma solani]